MEKDPMIFDIFEPLTQNTVQYDVKVRILW